MIGEKSLVAYKNRPAVVTGRDDKVSILVPGGSQVRVREKDVEFLHPGPAGKPETIEGTELTGDVRGAWELLEASLEGGSVPLKELAELIYGNFSPESAWASYALLAEGLYFTGNPDAVLPRDISSVEAGERKREEKGRESAEREAFLDRLKSGKLNLPDDGRFLQDAEALAYGRSDKSRTLRDLGRPETPVEAHTVLLNCGYWTPAINPHPARFGLSSLSAKSPVPPPPPEERRDLTALEAYAIDNAWSADPDDALSIEGNVLYVHVADPAASVLPGDEADMEARGRGSSLYLPEGTSRMLTVEALPLYALGLSETSPALTFKITLDEDASILETELFPSMVRVRRLTYAEADSLFGENPSLDALRGVAARNLERRKRNGAVLMDFPETHISVSGGAISIDPIAPSESADMVRECMLLAGEGAARWAMQHRIPFPYVAQETGDFPANILPGLAGFYQMRKCMRPRSVSTKPALHAGLGLEGYSQVTSPLRRYGDLLAHQQIRAFLRGDQVLSQDELLFRLGAGDSAALACVQAERASRTHWTAVYLSENKESRWKAVVMEKKGALATLAIPALGLETQLMVKDGDLNGEISVSPSSVTIPRLEINFKQVPEAISKLTEF